jgi:hypothetical protein
MFNKMEKYLAKSIGEIMAMSGCSLTELDSDQVRIWNEAIRYFNDCKEMTLEWAKSQDEINNKQKMTNQIMVGMIEKQRKLLERQSDQLDRIERKLDKKN